MIRPCHTQLSLCWRPANGNSLIFGQSYEVDKGEPGTHSENEENKTGRLGFFLITQDPQAPLGSLTPVTLFTSQLSPEDTETSSGEALVRPASRIGSKFLNWD